MYIYSYQHKNHINIYMSHYYRRTRSYSAGDLTDSRPSPTATKFKKVPSKSLLMAMDKETNDLVDLNLTLSPRLTAGTSVYSSSSLMAVAEEGYTVNHYPLKDESKDAINQPIHTKHEGTIPESNTSILSSIKQSVDNIVASSAVTSSTSVKVQDTMKAPSVESTNTSESVHVVLPSTYQSMSFSTSSDIARALAADYENRRRQRSASDMSTFPRPTPLSTTTKNATSNIVLNSDNQQQSGCNNINISENISTQSVNPTAPSSTTSKPPPAPETTKPFWTWSWGSLPVQSVSPTATPVVSSEMTMQSTPIVANETNTSVDLDNSNNAANQQVATAATDIPAISSISIDISSNDDSVQVPAPQSIISTNEVIINKLDDKGRDIEKADDGDITPIQVVTSVVIIDDEFTSQETQKIVPFGSDLQQLNSYHDFTTDKILIADTIGTGIANTIDYSIIESGGHTCGSTQFHGEIITHEVSRVFVLSMCGHILSEEANAPEPAPHTPEQLRALLLSYSIASQNVTVNTIQDPSLVAVVVDYLLPVSILYNLMHLSTIHRDSFSSTSDDDDMSERSASIMQSIHASVDANSAEVIETIQSLDSQLDKVQACLQKYISLAKLSDSMNTDDELIRKLIISNTSSAIIDNIDTAQSDQVTSTSAIATASVSNSSVSNTPEWAGCRISTWSRVYDSTHQLQHQQNSSNSLTLLSQDNLDHHRALKLPDSDASMNEDQPVPGLKLFSSNSSPHSPHSNTSRRSFPRSDPNQQSSTNLDRLRPENLITSSDTTDPLAWRVAPVMWRESFNELNSTFSMFKKPTEPYVEALSAYVKNDGTLPVYGKWDVDESSFRSQNFTVGSQLFSVENSSDQLYDGHHDINSSRQSPLPGHLSLGYGQNCPSDTASHVGLNIDDENSPSKQSSISVANAKNNNNNNNNSTSTMTMRPFSKSPLNRPMVVVAEEGFEIPELKLPDSPIIISNDTINVKSNISQSLYTSDQPSMIQSDILVTGYSINAIEDKYKSDTPCNSNGNGNGSGNNIGNTNNNTSSFVPIVMEDPEQEHLSLEDIPYDMISPEPAGGDFYDSDTDSYLSGSLSDSEPGAPLNLHKFRYRKVLVPNQCSLQSLELQDGVNEIIFEVEGHPSVRSQLFVWDDDSKIVIVDTEVSAIGTKRIGSGWFMSSPTPSPKLINSGAKKQESMPQILNNISIQGYKILYIAQQTIVPTKEYLAKLVAGTGTTLPTGPIFQSPDSLVRAFGAERTDLFKAAALRGLKGLFSPSHNPFFASFGVRPKDCLALTRCGVPEGRIFLASAETNEVLLAQNKTVKKSLLEFSQVLQEMFPSRVPISGNLYLYLYLHLYIHFYYIVVSLVVNYNAHVT